MIGIARRAFLAALLVYSASAIAARAADRAKPNIVLILADDLGFSDLGCYGSEIATPQLDALAGEGLRFTQFYNAARCCPTRAALLTGLSPHQAGVGHMLQDWTKIGAAYSPGLNDRCATIAELLRPFGYRSYHIGKWHVGGVGPKTEDRNHPLSRGFEHAYGTEGGGNYFAPAQLYLDRETVQPGADFYLTDALSDHAAQFLDEHARDHSGQPFFLHLCYTAPHFPLHAKPTDIAKYRGKFRHGWDEERARRFAKQRQLGIFAAETTLSPRDPVAVAWSAIAEAEREEWDLRMAVHAAMIDCMDQGIGRVLAALRRAGAEENTLVLFLSDNGASAEALDSWPKRARGHLPGSAVGTAESHRCLEIGWANAANTPFRENKMWAHEGGIATPLIARWPAGRLAKGAFTREPGHVMDLLPTFLELAGAPYPKNLAGRELTPLAGRSLEPVLRGGSLGPRTLAWEHEGNRAIRVADWKLVAAFGGEWELYDLARDRAETRNRAAEQPARVQNLAAAWEAWAQGAGVVPWAKMPVPATDRAPLIAANRNPFLESTPTLILPRGLRSPVFSFSMPLPLRTMLRRLLLALAFAAASPLSAADRPNILWIVTEDMSPHFGCYGEKIIATPNVDRLAAEGTRFARAFVTAPICSTSRSAMITGMYQTSIGAQHHRSGRGALKIALPPGVVPVPRLFKDAGYWTCNGGWPARGKGIAKTDYNFEWDEKMYDGGDWAGRAPGQPFFAQIQLHGGKVRDGKDAAKTFQNRLGSTTKPEDLPLPPYYPRTPAVLEDWALTLDACRLADQQVGEIRARLEKEGILEKTVLIFITDHGVSAPRGKQFLYDEGTHIPFVVRGPGIAAGKVRADLIEHIDMAAASLALAGIARPRTMQARDIFAADYQPRDAIFAARDRADETVDHIRSVRTDHWLYVRNFLPQRPHLQPNNYKDGKRCTIALRAARADGKLDALQERLIFSPTRPSEELYDTQADKFQIKNLASDPAHAAKLAEMRGRLDRWMEETDDRGRTPESPAQYDSEMTAYLGEGKKGERKDEVERNIAQMKKWAAEGK